MPKNSLTDNVSRWVLPNGLTVLLREDHSSGLVSTQVWVKTGSIHEGANLGRGLSHCLEHMLFKGTENRTGKEIDALIESLGGHHNAYTTYDRTVYHIDGPAEHAGIFLELLADMVLRATIPADELSTEKDVILREIAMYLDEPWDYLSNQSLLVQFEHSPYRYPIIGFANRFKEIDRSMLWKYYKDKYVPNNMVVIVTGSVAKSHLCDWTKQFFGSSVPKESQCDEVFFEKPTFCQKTLRLKGPYEQAYGQVQYALPMPGGRPMPGAVMLTRLLGSGEASLLWKRIFEEKQLVSSIGCHLSQKGIQGSLDIAYECEASSIPQVEAAIDELLTELKEKPLPAEYLERIKRQALVAEIDRLKTVGGQAAVLGKFEVVYGDYHYAKTFLDQLLAVEANDVQKIAQSFLLTYNCQLTSLSGGGERIDLSDIPLHLPVEEGISANEDQKKALEYCFVSKTKVLPSREDLSTSAAEDTPISNGSLLSPNFFDTVITDEGAEIYLQPNHTLPQVSIQIVFKAGSWIEKADKRGASQLLAAWLRRMRPENIEHIERLGGFLVDSVDGLSLGFSSEVLSEDLEICIHLLANVITWPDGPQAEAIFNREKTAQLNEIQLALNDIATYGFWELRPLVFGDYPFRDPVIGRTEALRSVTLQDLKALYEQIIVAHNAKIVVSGDFDSVEIQNKIKPLLAALPKKAFQFQLPVQGSPSFGFHERTLPDRSQVVLYEAYPMGGEVSLKDHRFTLAVISRMLSSMSGALFRKVRDAGLVYYAAATGLGGWDTSAWMLYAGTGGDKIEAIWEAFDDVIASLVEGRIDTGELQRAQIGLIVDQKMRMQTAMGRGRLALGSAFFGYGPNAPLDYPGKINAVAKDNIKTFAKEYFHKDKRVRLMVKPA